MLIYTGYKNLNIQKMNKMQKLRLFKYFGTSQIPKTWLHSFGLYIDFKNRRVT